VPRPSRRADVCATAARLFREYGYSSATMDLIADEVGLNKGTLYHYYPSKSAILNGESALRRINWSSVRRC
jgi:TetR/AcrR family transcriptional regulator, cholesterol catabolism regulator